MTLTDPIADMLTRTRNAARARFKSVDIPGSRMKTEVAKVLKEEGFIKNYKFVKDTKQGILRLYMKYDAERVCAIYGIERVSKPSRRVYVKSKEVPQVLNGLGIAILSTSKGIMTDKTARKENVGGEVLCNVW